VSRLHEIIDDEKAFQEFQTRRRHVPFGSRSKLAP
jgi:hypothetical protein